MPGRDVKGETWFCDHKNEFIYTEARPPIWGRDNARTWKKVRR